MDTSNRLKPEIPLGVNILRTKDGLRGSREFNNTGAQMLINIHSVISLPDEKLFLLVFVA